MRQTSGRIIVSAAFNLALFVLISYSVNILVHLQSARDAIKNIDDLLASPMLKGKWQCFNFRHKTMSILNQTYGTQIKPE